MPTQGAFKDGKSFLIVHAEGILFFVVACLYSLFSFILLLMISTSVTECEFCLVLEELNTPPMHTPSRKGVYFVKFWLGVQQLYENGYRCLQMNFKYKLSYYHAN